MVSPPHVFMMNFPSISLRLFHISCSRKMLENKLADAQVSEEEQNNLLKDLELKETEYMRRQRHKMGTDDFEPLTMIGKGAFGEVLLLLLLSLSLACILMNISFMFYSVFAG